MSAESSHCDVCGLRNGDHMCLECNKRCTTVDELVAHQKLRQHFGGHLILAEPSSRRRRAPARLRDNAIDELEADDDAGANTLDAVPAHDADEDFDVLAGDEPAEDDSGDDLSDDDDELSIDGDDNNSTASIDTPATSVRLRARIFFLCRTRTRLTSNTGCCYEPLGRKQKKL